jgi:hypothetical protein
MRKQFEELHPLFDLEKDEQVEYTCVLTRVTWLGFELGKKTLQAEIGELKHQKSLQELAVNQISQANQEWQRANSELQKRVDGLEQTLNKIAQWESHPVGYEVDFGSWGVRDFYRDLAKKALRDNK